MTWRVYFTQLLGITLLLTGNLVLANAARGRRGLWWTWAAATGLLLLWALLGEMAGGSLAVYLVAVCISTVAAAFVVQWRGDGGRRIGQPFAAGLATLLVCWFAVSYVFHLLGFGR